MKQRIKRFEEDSKILERIANQYGEHSREYGALKRASIALWYVLSEGHDKFRRYIAKFEGDLSPEQRRELMEMGIDPDDASFDV